MHLSASVSKFAIAIFNYLMTKFKQILCLDILEYYYIFFGRVMYKLSSIKLPIDFDKNNLSKYVSSKLKIDESLIFDSKLSKLSIDARDKTSVCFVASIIFDCRKNLNIDRYKNLSIYNATKIDFGKYNDGKKDNIIIVGSGPSGLFAGLVLAEAGANVTILERGYEMEKRKKAVEKMFESGVLDTQSNIQFGEGGAGTFSDGKLNTGISNEYIGKVYETFVKFGASEEILYDAKPHIGTDVLSQAIVNIRKYLESLGCKFLFEHTLCDVDVDGQGEAVDITVSSPTGKIKMSCDNLILAIGHSSRDTIRMLFDKNLQIKQKPFSMGYRIEHLQKDIDFAQYGEFCSRLPHADYHLSSHLKSGRCVYTFCMCPGGVVVPAMSEEETIVTNGMSYSARDGVNANSAILCTVEPSDFGSDHPLAGVFLQEKYERLAYSKNNAYKATVQRVGDFLAGVPTTRLGKVTPTFKPDYVLGDVSDMLPNFVASSIREGILDFDKKVKGFADADALLTGIETRSSAPYQVIRNLDMMSSIGGVYMIGEGAGFAGGIVSSAVEGIKCAKILIDKSYK